MSLIGRIAAPTKSRTKLRFARNFESGCYAADNSIGSRIEGSSFSGLLTRVEIGHIRIGSGRRPRLLSQDQGVKHAPKSDELLHQD
jgi:hypothetical protein